MIAIERLSYRYPGASRPVLCDVNLHIAAGEIVLVAGASGAGKSTLLRCLNGLVPHFYGGAIGGAIRVDGRDPLRAQPRGMSAVVGFVFQDPETQFVVDTVESELVVAMENHNLPPATMRVRLERVLAQLDIAHLRDRRISTLSGGEKQRVAIASVLTLEPRVLVLDEPTSQLDPGAAEDVLRILQELRRALGLTVVLSEHRLERVAPYVDRVIYLPGAGEPPRDGAPRDVLPETPFAPPIVALGRALGWTPLPLTVAEATPYAGALVEALGARGAWPAAAEAPHADAPLELVAEDLWHAYNGRPALRGVDLTVRRGEAVALMGRNGSGKTTLLKHLVGLLLPSRGSVRVRDRDTRRASVEDLIDVVGYVPQNPNALLFADTVREELAFTRRSHGLDGPHTPGGAGDDLLAALGIADHADDYPRDLSVGERQRVALAAILAGEPEIILLDEPTRGVDALQKGALLRYLAGERARGRTLLLSTHDVELAAAVADRVIVLEEGRVAADGPAREVLYRSDAFCPQIARLWRAADTGARRDPPADRRSGHAEPSLGPMTVDDVLRSLS